MMKENIQGGDNGKRENHSRCGRGRIRDRNGRWRQRAGSKALSLRLRSAEDDRLWNPRRCLQRQAEGAEQGHHADRAISGRAARAGAAGSAAGEIGRRGVLHLVKAIADPEVSKAVKAMIAETVQGAHVIALATLGLRNMYSKREIKNVADMKGLKVRVQATPTEDTMFPAYGAQIVHMPFGSVYTSLQTGVVDVAENGVNVYLANKHYEVAPVLSMTEHEANNSLVWVSDKVWNSLTPEQQGWVQAAADEVNQKQPAKAIELEHQSQEKLKAIGVKVVTDVDKSGFTAISDPYLDKLAKDLGPHAEKIKNLIRAIN